MALTDVRYVHVPHSSEMVIMPLTTLATLLKITRWHLAYCCFEFTDRQTAENLVEQLLRVANEWQVQDKVLCCGSDNAANITKNIKIPKWTHHPCLAHTLNLKRCPEAGENTRGQGKYYCGVFLQKHCSCREATHTQIELPEKRPKQECTTRWNSTFYMLKHILKMKDAIISTHFNTPVMLSQEEWELVKKVCTILQSFEEVTVEISEDG